MLKGNIGTLNVAVLRIQLVVVTLTEMKEIGSKKREERETKETRGEITHEINLLPQIKGTIS